MYVKYVYSYAALWLNCLKESLFEYDYSQRIIYTSILKKKKPETI